MKNDTEIRNAGSVLGKLGGTAYYAKYGDEGMSKLGQKGSKARAEKLTQEQRREIARTAAKARWAKHKEKRT